jgi:hypothetical protein
MTTQTCPDATTARANADRKPPRKPSSVILFQGPSLFDGKPIVVIATGIGRKSKNPKTGKMVQTYIMRSDMDPHATLLAKKDRTVCGTCPYASGNGCYVSVFKAPLTVWRCFERGSIPVATAEDIARLQTLPMRIGSYGDPGAVPLEVWSQLTSTNGSARTGYTHAWRTRSDLAPFAMASVDSAVEGHVARSQGWRTFRVISDDVDTGARPGEIECLSDSRGKSCIDCKLCSGKSEKSAKASIWITAHGSKSNRVGLTILQ